MKYDLSTRKFQPTTLQSVLLSLRYLNIKQHRFSLDFNHRDMGRNGTSSSQTWRSQLTSYEDVNRAETWIN